MKTYEITVPTINGPMTVEMTAKQFTTWHDQSTGWYNDHYKELTADPEDVEQAEDERNQDHFNAEKI
jgi:hypothetical protein